MEENKFTQYGLSQEIIEALIALEYKEPTFIQSQVIPLALEDRDIAAKSQTGSGKTAAFAIPLCEKVVWDIFAPQALVLEPTRELAVQVSDEIFRIGRRKRIKVPAVFGGFPIDKQITTLKQKNHIVVGTPGRIMDHLRRGTLKLQGVRYLIIDEADLMLQMGFIDEVKAIKEFLPKNRVTMLFSATLGEEVKELIGDFMKDPIDISVESETETAEGIEQIGYCVEKEDKYRDFLDVLIQENPKSAIIFAATREMVNTLYQKMKREKISCGMLHGLLEQRERLQTIEGFREGRFRYLIATDVAARGVDFEGIPLVINYDFPTDKENYVHRIGRTGRNGKTGRAVSFIQADETRYKEYVEEFTGVKIAIHALPNKEELKEKKKEFEKLQQTKITIKKKKGESLNRDITKLHIGGGKKSKMRTVDIVGTICSLDGISGDDIGVIDIRDSFTLVEIRNGKGQKVLNVLQTKPIKGKLRKVRKYR